MDYISFQELLLAGGAIVGLFLAGVILFDRIGHAVLWMWGRVRK